MGFGVKVPVPVSKDPKKVGAPKLDFEMLRSGGFAVSLRFWKLRGRVSWSKKNGFNISGGGRVPNKKKVTEDE